MPRDTRQQARARARRQAKHAQPVRAAREGRASLFPALLATGLLVGIIVVFVVVKATSHKGTSSSTAAPSGPAPARVLRDLASVPVGELAKAAASGGQGLSAISGDVPKVDGKPSVLYVGAEYCPYCAAERWPMVVALSKFGTFTGLGATHSASEDVYPDTATLSFHGSSYTSDHLAFAGVETNTNQRAGSSYGKLDTLTAAQQQLFTTYDAPPYVSGGSGSIPFVLFGGKAVQAGASYDPGVLKGLTVDEIATALTDPGSDVSKAVYPAAGRFVQTLCDLTGGAPAATCKAVAAK